MRGVVRYERTERPPLQRFGSSRSVQIPTDGRFVVLTGGYFVSLAPNVMAAMITNANAHNVWKETISHQFWSSDILTGNQTAAPGG